MADDSTTSGKPHRPSTSTLNLLTSSMTSPSPVATLKHRTPSNHHPNDAHNRSVFSPVLTPSGDPGGSMIMLSPSRTITETLTSLASSTARQLEEVWDEVGYNPEERASQLSDLIVQFRDICETKIHEETAVAESFRQEIANAKEEIKTTSAALKMGGDGSSSNSSSHTMLPSEQEKLGTSRISGLPVTNALTLTDELQNLEASLEGLRTAAAIAKEDLLECHEYLDQAHQALGLDMDPTFDDITSDLTARRRQLFHHKKAEMKEELSTRMAAVVQLVRDCQQMMRDLCMEPERDGSPLDRRIAGSLVRSKDGSFIMASKLRSDTCVGISAQAMEELTRQVAMLHGEKRRRKEKLQELGGEIAVLWEKLKVPEEEQRAFTKSVQGLGTDTMMKGETELQRLHALKSEMLGKLIDEARETIATLWEQTNTRQESRDSFSSFLTKDESLFNDELLEQHEDYIATLRGQLEQMKPILRLIERREAVLQERFEYEDLQKDPNRLKQRGAAMTKQLMAEEKMAKRIKRDLPKLTDMLVEKLEEWRKVHGQDFRYKGEHVYLDSMAQQELEWKEYKAEEMQRKLQKKQHGMGGDNGVASSSGNIAPMNKKRTKQPLSDATSKHNTVKQQLSKTTMGATKKPHHHHKTKAASVSTTMAPVRTLGEKTQSNRF